MSAPTLNRYWRLFNDLGFSPPPTVNPEPPAVIAEAFLGLTHRLSTSRDDAGYRPAHPATHIVSGAPTTDSSVDTSANTTPIAPDLGISAQLGGTTTSYNRGEVGNPECHRRTITDKNINKVFDVMLMIVHVL
ncbi:hypothetical protein GW17_00018695 [Ensete ventricosum]|nr:hypothetical protein GW17_00018695 [Ensete ventricosum]